jgi:(p)ppGpp synthase/HD superfamily hydrolase
MSSCITLDEGRFASALHLARRAHEGQYRKGSSTPYIAHPLAVAALALHYGADDDVAAAAVLHDAVEDGGGRPMLERIRWGIGERVAAIVDGCTDACGEPKGPWEERKRAYVARLPSLSNATKLVVACDKLDNLRATNDDLRTQGRSALEKFNAAPMRLRWYYRECYRAVGAAIPYALAERLRIELDAIEPWLA